MLRFSMSLIVIFLPSAFWNLSFWQFLLVGLGGLAIYAVLSEAWEKWRKHRTRSWPTAQGAVVDVLNTYESGGANGVRYWRISFRYNYTVNGIEHSGKYKFNCVSESQGKRAEEKLTCATVNVHYDPQDAAKGLLWEDEVWDLW